DAILAIKERVVLNKTLHLKILKCQLAFKKLFSHFYYENNLSTCDFHHRSGSKKEMRACSNECSLCTRCGVTFHEKVNAYVDYETDFSRCRNVKDIVNFFDLQNPRYKPHFRVWSPSLLEVNAPRQYQPILLLFIFGDPLNGQSWKCFANSLFLFAEAGIDHREYIYEFIVWSDEQHLFKAIEIILDAKLSAVESEEMCGDFWLVVDDLDE
ncbi:MAG TPA: hypothetical protein VK145_00810, partial [Candidatus Nanoarchaeia archaeon]|nr:hypothetical protein [Candidatus Nanoarchaeia archaeon]